MRHPTLSRDYWSLASGEARHNAAPETFDIPSLESRRTLARGQAAKLIFEIEAEEEDGTISVSTERMWVIVAQALEGFYMGILDNEPVTVPNDTGFYLARGSEVPFFPEHIIAIDTPPPDYAAERLDATPPHRWQVD